MHAATERVFAALGDPLRRKLLTVLADGEHSVGELVELLRAQGPISQPAVSQQLKTLREAGLVQVRSQGTQRLQSLDPSGVAAALSWLGELIDARSGDALLAPFSQPLDALATELVRGKRERPRLPAQDAAGLWPENGRGRELA